MRSAARIVLERQLGVLASQVRFGVLRRPPGFLGFVETLVEAPQVVQSVQESVRDGSSAGEARLSAAHAGHGVASADLDESLLALPTLPDHRSRHGLLDSPSRHLLQSLAVVDEQTLDVVPLPAARVAGVAVVVFHFT